MFFTVTLPVTLWFLDRGRPAGRIAARRPGAVHRRAAPVPAVTRALRVFDPEHIEFIANIVRLWRGEPVETDAGSDARLAEAFPGRYRDVPGLVQAATAPRSRRRTAALNPGRYVGVAPGQVVEDGIPQQAGSAAGVNWKG